MIRPAEPGDRPQVKALWMQAFEDDQVSTDHYFDHRHRDHYMLLDMEDGRLRAMLTMLPVDLIIGDQTLPARYFFAIATELRFRGQGISTKLIEAAECLCKQQAAAASLLVPASEELFRFYAKRGYVTRFYYKAQKLSQDDLPPCPRDYRLLPATAEAMHRLREGAFAKNRLFLRWDREALQYVIASAGDYGAPLLRFETANGEGYAYCEQDGETMIVKELALAGITVPEAVAILHRQLKAKSYLLRLAGEAEGEPGLIPFGMMKAFMPLPSTQGGVPYLSFAKD